MRTNRIIPGVLMVVVSGMLLVGCTCPVTPPMGPTDAPPTVVLPTAVLPTAVPPTPTPTPPEHRIAIRVVAGVGEFYDRQTGQKFVPRGVNYVFVPVAGGRYGNLTLKVGVYDGARTRQDFNLLAENGYNTVRVFLDHCSRGTGCIGADDNSGLNPAYIANIADMMMAAKEAGIFILFTSNDLPDQGGYAEEANLQAGEVFAGYRNSYYLTPGAVNATRRYWRDLLTGLSAAGAPFDAVLGWQLLNEQWMFADQPPLSLTSGMVETTTGVYDMSDPEQKELMVSEGLIYYIAQVREEILLYDSTALVTMGFFVPDLVAPGWYVETASLLAGSTLDFFDFHAYPGPLPLQDYAEHFGMLGFDEKPIIMGEYGAFRHVYGDLKIAARATAAWVAESCDYGFDGWLYWTYYPANPEIDDRTWGFTDEDGYLFSLFAPANQPDPCIPVEVSTGNVAYGKPVRVSSVFEGETPDLAVDEVDTTQWGAGADAPQWIEVDLQGSYRVTEIRLLVAQWPAGTTTHNLMVSGASGEFVLVHQFSGNTQDGDWLAFTPDTPLEDVQKVRIYTVTSPSWVAWKEIQVYTE